MTLLLSSSSVQYLYHRITFIIFQARVMQHNLLLLHSSTAAYYAGDDERLDAVLKQFNVRVKSPNPSGSPVHLQGPSFTQSYTNSLPQPLHESSVDFSLDPARDSVSINGLAPTARIDRPWWMHCIGIGTRVVVVVKRHFIWRVEADVHCHVLQPQPAFPPRVSTSFNFVPIAFSMGDLWFVQFTQQHCFISSLSLHRLPNSTCLSLLEHPGLSSKQWNSVVLYWLFSLCPLLIGSTSRPSWQIQITWFLFLFILYARGVLLLRISCKSSRIEMLLVQCNSANGETIDQYTKANIQMLRYSRFVVGAKLHQSSHKRKSGRNSGAQHCDQTKCNNGWSISSGATYNPVTQFVMNRKARCSLQVISISVIDRYSWVLINTILLHWMDEFGSIKTR